MSISYIIVVVIVVAVVVFVVVVIIIIIIIIGVVVFVVINMEIFIRWNFGECTCDLKEVHLFSGNVNRPLIFGYNLHKHFMPEIPKLEQYLQYSLFMT